MIIQHDFKSRKELYEAGLHNSYQRGIGRAKDGTNYVSIVLSGGYVDDEDFGDEIIYTGEGGRDPASGKQIADQEIRAGNKNLVAAFEAGEPVYVTRGSGHKGNYSPVSGYRFAGEYYIAEHWIEKGRDGFSVVRFKLVNSDKFVKPATHSEQSVQRVEIISTRIIRDTKLSKTVKEMYEYTCQVCNARIELPTGNFYMEGAHIRPLGKPHDGPDNLSNILCLCPNHHLMFDKYCYSINPESLELVGIDGFLTLKNEHVLDTAHLSYHYENYLAHR